MGAASTAELDAVLEHYRQGRAETSVVDGGGEPDRQDVAGTTTVAGTAGSGTESVTPRGVANSADILAGTDYAYDLHHPKSILHMALEVTRGARNEDYGHPLDDYTRTAAMWTAYLGHEVTAEQAMGCMILVKMSRLAHTPGHMDSLVDVAGYADCMHRANLEAIRRNG